MPLKNVLKFFKSKDYSSTQHVVVLANLTTRTELRFLDNVKISEVGERSIVLRMPKNSCNIGHRLLVHIMPKEVAQQLGKANLHVNLQAEMQDVLSVNAEVKEMEAVGTKLTLVTADLTVYVEKDWKEFVKLRSSIQKKVDRLFKRIKE